MIFKLYKSKEQLLLSIITEFLSNVSSQTNEHFLAQLLPENNETFEQFLEALIINQFQMVQNNHELFQLFFKEAIYNEELKKLMFPRFSQNLSTLLTAAIKTAKSRGELIDLPEKQLLKILQTNIFGFIISSSLINETSVDEEEIKTHVFILMNGIKLKKEDAKNGSH